LWADEQSVLVFARAQMLAVIAEPDSKDFWVFEAVAVRAMSHIASWSVVLRMT
jgi:hypothetical protein